MGLASTKQRLVDLDLTEVSLVDIPANEEEFLVVKSKGSEESMSEQGKTAEPDQAGDIVKSISNLTEMIKGGKIPQDESGLKNFRSAMKSFSELLGLGTADLSKAARCIECGFVCKSDTSKCGSCGGVVQKSAEVATSVQTAGQEQGTHITVQPDGTVLVKGVKQFSRDRLSAVKAALSQLMGVMKDADPSAFAELMAGFTGGASSSQASSSMSIEPAVKSQNQTPVVPPAVPPELTAALDKLTTIVGEVSKRLETVEKSQGVSKSLPDGKGDQVTQKDTNMWKGLV